MIRIAYSPIYEHPLPPNHKFPMKKYSELAKRLISLNYFTEENFFVPTMGSEEILNLTHEYSYITRSKDSQLSKMEERRLGFPQSKLLYEREVIIADGTLEGAKFALDNGLSFNIAGGTHHAFTNKGEGFCMFNDIAVATNYLLNIGLVKKVLVVDLDVHQGNGTAEIFANNNSVFTFSMHGKNNYPLKKEKSDLDIELEDLTSDNEYLRILEQQLPKLINLVKPDIVFYQAGVDILDSDKFGRLSVTIEGTKTRDEIVFTNCKQNSIPVVCVMGGGYSKDLEIILEAHLNTYKLGQKIFD